MDQELSTQGRILEAARRVFIRKGFDGARMQEIADEAGINKALLHYHFRNKQMLFEAVFQEALSTLLPQILEVIGSESGLPEKIQAFVERYIDFLTKNPYLPLFILTEIQRNPANITRHFSMVEGRMKNVLGQFGKIPSSGMSAEQILVNLVSLTVFPIAARPILQMMLFDGDESRYDSFLRQRPEQIKLLLTPMLGTLTKEK